MKSTVLFAALMAIAVPATAAPLDSRGTKGCKAGHGPNPDAAADAQGFHNGGYSGGWGHGNIDWSSAANNWRTRTRTRTPVAQPTPQPEQPSPSPVQPSPEPEQPAPEQPSPQPEQPSPSPVQPSPEPEQPAPEQPSPQPEQPSPQPEQPSPSPTPTPSPTPVVNVDEPQYTTAVEPPKTGEPTLPYVNDQTVATQDSTAADIAGTSEQAKVALDYHNKWRAQFGTGPLTWDAGLAKKAADAMGTCKWEHIGADNLSALWGSGSVVNHFVHNLIDGWANEWKLYDWNNPGFSMETGHFTAMNWKAVTKVGCGWKLGCKDATPGAGFEQKIYFSCIYDPAPNMGGMDDATTRKNYEANVLRFGGK